MYPLFIAEGIVEALPMRHLCIAFLFVFCTGRQPRVFALSVPLPPPHTRRSAFSFCIRQAWRMKMPLICFVHCVRIISGYKNFVSLAEHKFRRNTFVPCRRIPSAAQIPISPSPSPHPASIMPQKRLKKGCGKHAERRHPRQCQKSKRIKHIFTTH